MSPDDAPAPQPAEPTAPEPAVPEPAAAEPPAAGDGTPQAPGAVTAERPPAGSESPTLRWVVELGAKVRAFTVTRQLRAGAVKVTLADGEWFYVDSVEPGPGEGFVSFSAYPPPDEMAQQMVAVSLPVEGEQEPKRAYMTPRIVIARIEAVRKIELLSQPPRDHPMGFTVRTDLVRASATPGP